MIKVVYSSQKDRLIFQMTGHAETAEKGKDLVCASASILAYTLAQTVLKNYKKAYYLKKPVVDLKEGNAVIMCKVQDGWQRGDTEIAFKTIIEGVRLLEANYPNAVQLKVFKAE